MITNLKYVTLTLLLLLAGCAGDETVGDPDTLSVVASFYPLAEAATKVGGERVEVTNLTPPGAEPHDLELTTEALDRVIGADVVLYLAGLQPAVDEAIEQQDIKAVNVIAGLDIRRGDPHVWLDPTLWSRAITRNIVPALHIEDRRASDAYIKVLQRIGDEYASGLASCDRNEIVTAHAAFAYLAEPYDLTQHAITGVSPEAEPDPRRLAELADLVREDGLTTVFTEELVSPAVAQTLAREANVKTAVLDPIESQPKGGYAGAMRRNLVALRDALGCV
jgi:zinc transport system substrate-binding protein